MSDENVDTVRAVIEALNRHDLDGMAERVGPECAIDMSRAQWAPNRGVHSIESFRSLLKDRDGAIRRVTHRIGALVV